MLTLQLVTSRKKFPEQRGFVCAKIIDKNHRRSLLMQGGLEVPLQVTADCTKEVLKRLEDFDSDADDEVQSNR